MPKGLTYSVGRLFAGMGEDEEELSVAEWGQPPGLLQRPHSRPFACNSNELGFPPLLFKGLDGGCGARGLCSCMPGVPTRLNPLGSLHVIVEWLSRATARCSLEG